MSYYERIKGIGLRGEPFDVVGTDGVRRIGFKQGPPGEGGFRVPEHLVWEIYPDGSAKYVRRWVTYRAWNPQMAGLNNPPNVVVVPDAKAGTPAWTYSFSPDAFKLFRAVASLYPNGVTETGVHRYGMIWPEWDFPFTGQDSAAMRQWIISLSPAEAFGLYYSLVLYNGPQVGLCTYRKFIPEVTPKEFESNSFWPVYQQMLMQAIYAVRTDLYKIRDPDTGETIDGLIKYDLFTMPCKKSFGESLVGYVGIAGQVAMSFVTLGASTAFQAVSTTVDVAMNIVKTVDDAKKQRAIQAFTNSVIKGYSSGMDIRNVIDPKPDLSQVEKELLGKATGETKSPTETSVVAGEAVKSSGIPWLLLAGAAAALLS
jgi:hypothetical protein